MKIAVIGSGISGLLCAHLLRDEHDITLFEASDQLGGHTHTERFDLDGRSYAVDTGFIVYAARAYPNFARLLARLGIASADSPLSFSVSCERTGLEYNTRSANRLLAQRQNLLRPTFLRMVLDIARFGRDAESILARIDDSTTVGEFFERQRYSRALIDLHLIPAGAALWSTTPERVRAFSARAFIRYFQRHGFLGLRSGLPWSYIPGGSDRYVTAMAQPLRDRIRLGTAVRSVRRSPARVTVETRQGESLEFDRVIVATHSDQALALLADPSERERDLLGAFAYHATEVILHTDASILPRARRAWAAWNTRIRKGPGERIAITYNMNIVQRLRAPQVFCVTLHGRDRIDPARVLRSYDYHHPVFTPRSGAAQARHHEVNGENRTHLCGAYWGFGFHEDAVNSALAVCERFGKSL